MRDVRPLSNSWTEARADDRDVGPRGDEQRNQRLGIAEQRLVGAERLISRLHLLEEERRAFGLSTAGVEALITLFEARTAIWSQHRDDIFGLDREPVATSDGQDAKAGCKSDERR
jgi:hypothetical protein